MGKFAEIVNLSGRTLRRFISLSFIFAVMILLVRLYESVVVYNTSNYPPGSIYSLLTGLKFDIIFYLRVSAILMVPYLLLGLISQKVARYFFIVVSLLLVLIDMLLLKYFSTARVPLGADLFGYSPDEIKHTIQTSGEASIWPIIFMALFLAYMFRVFVKHVYFKLKPWLTGVIACIMLISLVPLKLLSPQPASFSNEFNMFVATNKLDFFCESVVNRYIFSLKTEKEDYLFNTIASTGDNAFTYIDEAYPFLHTENTPNVLGDYFDLGGTSPNIVFIIVESLGRAYSGEGAYLGSFTPFLDSLANQSLYWENCLSTSGRTFEVLPSTLASVPFGEKGFAELGENMPDHISLISLLKTGAGYTSKFIYGGEAHFDNMDLFLIRQGLDKIIDSGKYGDDYDKLPSAPNGFSWGYGDREIFRRYMNEIKSDTMLRMDVLLTMAMHDPFIVPDQEYYIAKFNELLNKQNLTEATVEFNKTYEKEFSTILYFDESLEYFFDEMKKLSSFDSTIFIITGDHRMPEIPISTQLDRFHVPLVIYSPMLKKAAKFSSVVTHFDITPSLVALLDENKTITRPTVASWIGHGLDATEVFQNIRSYPLMRNKNELLDYIDGERMLANNVIYQVYNTMDIEPVNENDKLAELKSKLSNFVLQSNYACNNNKLIPDSLKKYTFH